MHPACSGEEMGVTLEDNSQEMPLFYPGGPENQTQAFSLDSK
ncbi:hypothetical protein LEMLEM_LOCUS12242, partial [Lemmus lemmus]